MCGIAGIFRKDGQPADCSILQKICEHMVHRGPDGDGYFTSGSFGMGMRRLTIIDIMGGRQPISNEDGRYQVILNEEIYNYLELRAELEHRGHQFHTHSDTEVIVHLFEERGTESVHALNGMFSFAIWDNLARKLFIFRDRLGIKPLYYFSGATLFAFSSDLISLSEAVSDISINHDAFFNYLGLGYVPYSESILEGINKLEPGTFLVVSESGVSIHPYWNIEQVKEIHLNKSCEYKELIRSVAEDAVRIQMRSDVPVGIFLSGGIDSTAVLGMASNLSGEKIRTFSVGFEGGYNELEPAREMALLYKTDHEEILVRRTDIPPLLMDAIKNMDEPIADNSIVPSSLLAKLARNKGVPVVLTGAGGDELFGGYPRYFKDARGFKNRVLQALPGSMRSLVGQICKLFNKDLAYRITDHRFDYPVSISGVGFDFLRRLLRKQEHFINVLQKLTEHYDNYVGRQPQSASKNLMLFDVRSYLVDDILALTDKMTMGASVEARVPFLDHRLAEICFGCPDEILFPRAGTKPLERDIFHDILPHSILNLPKAGFAGPTTHWVNSPEILNIIKQNLLEAPTPFFSDYFSSKSIEQMISSIQYSTYASNTLWILLVFDLWYRKHIGKENI